MKIVSENRVRRGRIAVQKAGRKIRAFIATGSNVSRAAKKALVRGRAVKKALLHTGSFNLDDIQVIHTPVSWTAKKKSAKATVAKAETTLASVAVRARRPTKAEIEFFQKRSAAGLGVGLDAGGTLVRARKA